MEEELCRPPAGRQEPGARAEGPGSRGCPEPPETARTLTLHLGLVDEQELGGAAALKLLARAPLGAELLVLALVQGEERGGEAAEAGGAGQRR